MRVNELSALINSVSKLIFKWFTGLAQMPNNPAYSLISVSLGLATGPGVAKAKAPPPIAVQPSGSTPAASAQSPRLALLGKNTSLMVSKSLSSMERWRKRKPPRAPSFDENWYSSSDRLVFSSCFSKRLETANERSGADEPLCAGVPGTALAGGTQAIDTGSPAGAVNAFGVASRFGVKNEQLELSNSAGLCQFEKWNESTKLSLSVMCQVAPKSAVAATWRPKTGPLLVWLYK